MDLLTGFLVYFVVWWISLFIVLPFGVQSQEESGEVVPGSERGAPAKTNLLKKFVINTFVAMLIWGLIYIIIVFDLFAIAPE